MARYQNLGDDLSGMLPEHTKTIPRIIIWSIIFIADLILAAAAAFRLGLLLPESSSLEELLYLGFLFAVAGALFWVESFLWNVFRRLFR